MVSFLMIIVSSAVTNTLAASAVDTNITDIADIKNPLCNPKNPILLSVFNLSKKSSYTVLGLVRPFLREEFQTNYQTALAYIQCNKNLWHVVKDIPKIANTRTPAKVLDDMTYTLEKIVQDLHLVHKAVVERATESGKLGLPNDQILFMALTEELQKVKVAMAKLIPSFNLESLGNPIVRIPALSKNKCEKSLRNGALLYDCMNLVEFASDVALDLYSKLCRGPYS